MDFACFSVLTVSSFSMQLSEAMKAGKLLPDEVIFNLLSKRLEQGLSAGERGFILDGFPRTISQAVREFASDLEPAVGCSFVFKIPSMCLTSSTDNGFCICRKF